jgi:hypothetical protein
LAVVAAENALNRAINASGIPDQDGKLAIQNNAKTLDDELGSAVIDKDPDMKTAEAPEVEWGLADMI